MSTRWTVRPLISMPRIAEACSSASSGVFASLTPPALPRPPALTCALTTTTPSSSAAARASSGVVATMPERDRDVVLGEELLRLVLHQIHCNTCVLFVAYRSEQRPHTYLRPTLDPSVRLPTRSRSPDVIHGIRPGRRPAYRRGMTRFVYYTATTLDGFIADENNSLDWLFEVARDPRRRQSWDAFIAGIGAMVMGATTYEWVLAHDDLLEHPERWHGYYATGPCWVFSHRDLPADPRRRPALRPGRRRAGVRRPGRGGRRARRLARRRRRPGRPVRRRRPCSTRCSWASARCSSGPARRCCRAGSPRSGSRSATCTARASSVTARPRRRAADDGTAAGVRRSAARRSARRPSR